MEAGFKLENEALEALRRKYFPRVPWTEQGPVRRRYGVRAAAEDKSAVRALTELAVKEGFVGPGQCAVTGDADRCLATFRRRVDSGTVAMIFGTGLDADWCDIAFGPTDEEGWQEMIIRSEEAENLIALAHAVGALRFRRAK